VKQNTAFVTIALGASLILSAFGQAASAEDGKFLTLFVFFRRNRLEGEVLL